MNRAATREDVARAAGVSVATVSRAVNNSGYVKKEVRERILSIADSMDYNPNPIAMLLSSRKTRQLVLYQNEITASYNIQFYNGATRAAYKRDYAIFLDINCDFGRIKRHLVDGVLFSLDVLAEEYINALGGSYRLPIVVATNDASLTFACPVHNVVIDNPKIVNMAIDYLHGKGHRLIGLVIPEKGRHSELRYGLWRARMERDIRRSGQSPNLEDLVIRAEISGAEDVPVINLEPPLILQTTSDDFANYSSFNIGRRAAKRYLQGDNPATALLCFNDDMAYGFIREAERGGISIPKDVSVMGIDGIYLREWFEKKVTTVSINAENIGAACANVMIDILENEKTRFMTWTVPRVLEGETVRNMK